jgi:NADH:ubiquinone oxidoreductase subunit 6 (subunit J)
MKKALFLILITLISISVVGSTELMAQDAVPVSDEGTGWIDIALYLSYLMIIVGALGAIILPIFKASGDPKSLLQSGIGVAGILVLFFIAYAISGNEVTPAYAPFNVTPGSSKLIGGIIITSYLLILVAIIGIVYTEIKNVIS